MSKREIAVLAVRLISIQLFLACLSKFEDLIRAGVDVFNHMQRAQRMTAGIGNTPPFNTNWITHTPMGAMNQDNLWILVGLNLLSISLWFLLVGYLWFSAPRLSHSLVQEYVDEPALDMRGLDVQRLAFSLLGIYVLVGILPGFASSVLAWIWDQIRWTLMTGPQFPQYHFQWYDSIRLFFALWLTLGTRGIVGLIHRTREWAKSRN